MIIFNVGAADRDVPRGLMAVHAALGGDVPTGLGAAPLTRARDSSRKRDSFQRGSGSA